MRVAADMEPNAARATGSVALNTVAGDLDADLDVTWGDRTTVNSVVQFSNLDPSAWRADLNGLLAGDLRLDASLQDTVPRAAFDLAVSGTFLDRLLTLDGRGEFDDGVVRLAENGLTLTNGDNTVSLFGDIGAQLDSRAVLNITDLSTLVPDMAGAVVGEVRASGTPDRPSGRVRLEADALSVADNRIGAALVEATLEDAGRAVSSLDLSLNDVVMGEQTVDNTRLSVRGTQAAHAFELGVVAQALETELTGEGGWSGAEWRAVLNAAALSAQGHTWKTTSNVALTASQTGVQLGPHCWASTPQRFACWTMRSWLRQDVHRSI